MLRAATPYLMSWDDVSEQDLQANISAPTIPNLLDMSLEGLSQLMDIKILDSNLPLNNSEPTNSLLNSSANLLTPGSAIDQLKVLKPSRLMSETGN